MLAFLRGVKRRLKINENGWANFYTIYTCSFLLVSLVAGAIIATIDNLDYLDGFFMATSAVTGSGLSTISMQVLSGGSFAIMGLLTFFGQSFMVMGVYPCIARWIYMHYRPIYLRGVVARATTLAAWVHVTYILLWHMIMIPVLIGALYIRPQSPELAERNFTREAEAFFLVISSFSNCGLTLTSDSLTHLIDNPFAYCCSAILILAGYTFAPVFMRCYILCLRWIKMQICIDDDLDDFDELLNNGADYSTILYSARSTVYLFSINTLILLVQYLFFLFSELVRKDAIGLYGGSVATLVGMGSFQSISNRYAGFQIIDLRQVSQGLLVIYGKNFQQNDYMMHA